MTVNAITDTKKGRTGIAPTYLHTTRLCLWNKSVHAWQTQNQKLLKSIQTANKNADNTATLPNPNLTDPNLYNILQTLSRK